MGQKWNPPVRVSQTVPSDQYDLQTVRVIKQRCPICEGRKFVPAGFYTGLAASLNPDQCQQCNGTGMVTATETVTTVRRGLLSDVETDRPFSTSRLAHHPRVRRRLPLAG